MVACLSTFKQLQLSRNFPQLVFKLLFLEANPVFKRLYIHTFDTRTSNVLGSLVAVQNVQQSVALPGPRALLLAQGHKVLYKLLIFLNKRFLLPFERVHDLELACIDHASNFFAALCIKTVLDVTFECPDSKGR